MTTFTGRWVSSFGPMELTQDEAHIHGTYWYQGIPSSIAGDLQDGRFTFRYQDASGPGAGWFELKRYGEFHGQYQLDASPAPGEWSGHREWDGIWDTSFGRMRLIQEEDRIHGSYSGVGQSRIDGRLEGSRLVFRYTEPKTQGAGWFELNSEPFSFHGAWQPDGATGTGEWVGRRAFPMPGVVWLMVIEAHWQRVLTDHDYSYGNMLREIFARIPNVLVRQRFFNDQPSLERWCRELVYYPEPAIVLIASHGLPEGIVVQGQTIETRAIVDSLREATNVRLLHFSACLVLKEEAAGDFARRVGSAVPFPISGYTTSADWGGSAVVEFSYLDMILGKNVPPETAARLLPSTVSYAGDDAPADSPYVPVGFRFHPAGQSASEQ